ncbi:hypothetical protein DFJ58DRAFT_838447 [Suillus subalutaceus]|uniref:uncharacterized protein n=1 Tax=Suillus subalutaceus TaxID=48586 RepID=UPI001B86BE61|nr:uncharacterized protein DFJ58DRAFT_838447 [Suillus subalutaceus]KAG1865791.1 hypothetical protein DFJ58DRAFT_838447 [Suillus subalutaceus]
MNTCVNRANSTGVNPPTSFVLAMPVKAKTSERKTGHWHNRNLPVSGFRKLGRSKKRLLRGLVVLIIPKVMPVNIPNIFPGQSYVSVTKFPTTNDSTSTNDIGDLTAGAIRAIYASIYSSMQAVSSPDRLLQEWPAPDQHF